MPRFFVPQEQFHGDTVSICGADHLHLARVLRARVGDNVEVLDNRGGAFFASIMAIERTCTQLRIGGALIPKPEPLTVVKVAQALGKADKFEQVVQHGTEVGATEFTPVQADRCVLNLRSAGDRTAERLVRWNQIAKDAAQQCGRCRIPVVNAPVPSVDLFRRPEDTAEAAIRVLLHPHAESVSLQSVLGALTGHPREIMIAIGPEGGWSSEEVIAARGSGWITVGLGPYVLRTETAALVAISRIMHCFEV